MRRAGERVEGLITDVGGVLKDNTKGLDEKAKDIGNNLGNLFGNKKKDQ